MSPLVSTSLPRQAHRKMKCNYHKEIVFHFFCLPILVLTALLRWLKWTSLCINQKWTMLVICARSCRSIQAFGEKCQDVSSLMQPQSKTHFPKDGDVYLWFLFLFCMKAIRWNDKWSWCWLSYYCQMELDLLTLTRSQLCSLTSLLSWFCFFNPSFHLVLSSFLLHFISLFPPSLHLSFIISPYIRPSTAVIESEYRCNCQMDRWGLPWFSAKIQILAFSCSLTHKQNNINTYYNWNHISQITYKDLEVFNFKYVFY